MRVYIDKFWRRAKSPFVIPLGPVQLLLSMRRAFTGIKQSPAPGTARPHCGQTRPTREAGYRAANSKPAKRVGVHE